MPKISILLEVTKQADKSYRVAARRVGYTEAHDVIENFVQTLYDMALPQSDKQLCELLSGLVKEPTQRKG